MAVDIQPQVSEAAKADILDLDRRINLFRSGQYDEERFRAFRLTRGVYGQRQLGVQMLRIKIPYGRINGKQLKRIADMAAQYTNGNLHITTRQDIQLHYVKLDDSPQIWAKLEEEGITTKEACGNTVRNVTGSPFAGIDAQEPFDISPYAHATFEHFLRNPICQEMGRKVKIAFSSNEDDTAFAYIHDFGLIPQIQKTEDGKEIRGFKVLIGGGLGAQAFFAPTAYEFLPEDQILPFMEAAIRVFDRHGEREKRHKARMKFLVNEKTGVGFEKFMELIEEQRTALPKKSIQIDRNLVPDAPIPEPKSIPEIDITDQGKLERLERWIELNTEEQKQKGYYLAKVKVELGNISAEKTHALVDALDGYIADDYRLTVNQGIVLRYIEKDALPYIWSKLDELGFGDAGFDSIADITACPGTDTCNLGVTNSTDMSVYLEKMIQDEYPDLVKKSEIRIKNSGCMNACGQHMIAHIGFHGSSIKKGALVIPALQVVLGGGIDPDGGKYIAEKVIKLPTKRIPDAIRYSLNDYLQNRKEDELFNQYYYRLGKMHFYGLLKPLANLETLTDDDFKDWGQDEGYVQEIGVGECAGVVLDMVATIIGDAEERLEKAIKGFEEGVHADSIYSSYGAMVIAAKALLLSKDVRCNTHIGIIKDFDEHFVANGQIALDEDFKSYVLKINQNEPSESFAKEYLEQANEFLNQVKAMRAAQVSSDQSQEEKLVVDQFYKA